ncbi:hypothetical protein H696_00453 [Fonticula alba]|uniref:glutaminase n=1 Tax=Fonticula alba TaxID=691883 RepID=A0A058ZHC5_FONAL|nr:hypothetical protein H696_00453 [Fonticula alba]KCV72882.1 hypothetical protein H696_00453 [Fonticula alba]|eukprot:XP_009492583.1 hypothetical protein H696_00453 [Fonticula alba]
MSRMFDRSSGSASTSRSTNRPVSVNISDPPACKAPSLDQIRTSFNAIYHTYIGVPMKVSAGSVPLPSEEEPPALHPDWVFDFLIRSGLDPAETRDHQSTRIPASLSFDHTMPPGLAAGRQAPGPGANATNQAPTLQERVYELVGENGLIGLVAFFVLQTFQPESLLARALRGALVLPSFAEFCEDLIECLESVRHDTYGQVASYIPALAQADPDKLAFAICSVDGQRFAYGDYQNVFSMQSTCKPFAYCLAAQENGLEAVHRHIGREPSGARFNAFALNRHGLPHNPMINAGAITAHSLIRSNWRSSRRIHYIIDTFHVGALPENADVKATLELYLRACALEVDVRTLAAMASTLSNGGVSPLTCERVISQETTKSCLQLLLSCGMYDSSGEWACTTGLPAKSGVSGAIFICVPNVMGLAVWSPRLDARGNSHRGVQFAKAVCQKFALSIFDQMLPGANQVDPTMSELPKTNGPIPPVANSFDEGHGHPAPPLQEATVGVADAQLQASQMPV